MARPSVLDRDSINYSVENRKSNVLSDKRLNANSLKVNTEKP